MLRDQRTNAPFTVVFLCATLTQPRVWERILWKVNICLSNTFDNDWQLIFAKIGLKINWSVLRYRKRAQSTAVLRLIMQRSCLFWPVTGQKRQLPPKMVWSHNLHIIASGHFLIQVTRHSPPKRTVYSQFRLEGTKWIETVFQRILLYSATEFAHFGICNGKLKVVGIKDEKSQTKRFLKRWYRRFLPVLPSADMHVSHFVVDNIVQLD